MELGNHQQAGIPHPSSLVMLHTAAAAINHSCSNEVNDLGSLLIMSSPNTGLPLPSLRGLSVGDSSSTCCRWLRFLNQLPFTGCPQLNSCVFPKLADQAAGHPWPQSISRGTCVLSKF